MAGPQINQATGGKVEVKISGAMEIKPLTPNVVVTRV